MNSAPCHESEQVHEIHVISKEQTALIAITFVVAFASTLSRSIRDGDRRSNWRLFGLGCTSGFLGVGLYCVGSPYLSGLLGSAANLVWIGISALVGFTAPYQDKIGADLFVAAVNKVLGGTVATLQAMQSLVKKKEDE